VESQGLVGRYREHPTGEDEFVNAEGMISLRKNFLFTRW
jgi:hypothetical protein